MTSPKTEEELRAGAAERLLLAIVPGIDDQVLADAEATLHAELIATQDPDEITEIRAAMQLLSDGRNRWAGPELTGWLRRD